MMKDVDKMCKSVVIITINYDFDLMPFNSHSTQGRHHRLDWGEYVHPTIARGRSWDWCRSDELFRGV